MRKLYFFSILFSLAINYSYSQEKPLLNIVVDDRIETLYTIAYLDNYSLVSKHKSLYTNYIDQKLSTLKNHNAVALFDTISKKYNFSYYRTVEWALQYSHLPEFKKEKNRADKNDPLIAEGKEYLLEEFRTAMISFYNDSLFQKYRNEMQTINNKVIATIRESKSIELLPQYLESYYGQKLASYNLIISPLLHSGGFNAEIVNEKQNKEVYALIGPNGEIKFYPYFEKDYLEMDLILHEFGHSFVNPLMEKYEKEIDKLRPKYYTEQLRKNGKEQGYQEWKYVFNEILLRAIVINITEKKFGIAKATKLLEFEKSVGFDLVEVFEKKLKLYEKQRKTYKNFADYYPKLLTDLR